MPIWYHARYFEKCSSCGNLYATYRHLYFNILRRYSSGQRGQTVNLLALAYEGSNPSRRTRIKKLKHLLGHFLLRAPGSKMSGGHFTRDSKPD